MPSAQSTTITDVQQRRNTILYTRVKKKNYMFVKNEMKRLNFKSQSEYVDALIELASLGKKAKNDRKAKRVSATRKKAK